MNPLVICIMPTRGRQEMALKAQQCFIEQDYPNKELLILDDYSDPSFIMPLLFRPSRRIHYRVTDIRNIAEKRNVCVSLAAHADLICHWDSDDISAPNRLSSQVNQLQESGKAMVGFHTMKFLDERAGKAYRYTGHLNDPYYALGTSLLYRREFWELHHFVEDLEPPMAEDFEFVQYAREMNQIMSFDAGDLLIARIHDDNSSPAYKQMQGWDEMREIPRESIPV